MILLAYCQIDDLQAQVAGRRIVFNDSPASSPISLTQANNFILQIYSEINETIHRSGYQAPITSNGYLSLTNAIGAAYLCEMAMNVDGTAESMAVVKYKQGEYQRRLDNIEKNPRLAGAIPSSGAQNNIITSDGVSNYTENSNTNFPFHRDSRDW